MGEYVGECVDDCMWVSGMWRMCGWLCVCVRLWVCGWVCCRVGVWMGVLSCGCVDGRVVWLIGWMSVRLSVWMNVTFWVDMA